MALCHRADHTLFLGRVQRMVRDDFVGGSAGSPKALDNAILKHLEAM